MNDKRKVLGRGLESLVPAARGMPSPERAAPPERFAAGEPVHELPVDKIDRNPYQTRRHFDEAAMAELAASVAAAGVVQPVVVRPQNAGGRYTLVVGERRWLAAQRAGLSTVPAVVRLMSSQRAMEITIIENLQREDLNAMEQARAYERLSGEFGMTQEQMAQRTGKDRSSVANYLRLLKLPAAVQSQVDDGALSFGHAKALMVLEEHDLIARIAAEVAKDHLSVRQTEKLVQETLYPRPAAAKPERKQAGDANVREAERSLQRALGINAQINDRNGKGRIILPYGSLDDFDRLMERLMPELR